MNKKRVIGKLIFFLMIASPLAAQYETLLLRFTPEVSPFSLALGGKGTTVFARADGIYFNPSLAATLERAVVHFNGLSDALKGRLPKQLETETKRDYLFDLEGNSSGIRSIVLAFPWKWQNLIVSLSAGWSHTYPYGYKGRGRGLWLDQEQVFLGADQTDFLGTGSLNTLWLGGAVAFQDYFGFGISHSIWKGEGAWQTAYRSDLDEEERFNGRRERLDAVSWTVGAFFKPMDKLLLTASVQSRCVGDFRYSFFEDPEKAVDNEETEENVTTIKIPETLNFGLAFGPFYETSLHAEYHTQLWSQASLEAYPNGTVFPAFEVAEQAQQNEVLFSLGLSHRLKINSVIDCIFALGLGWEQPLFNSPQEESLVLNRYSIGATIQIGRFINVSAAYRQSSGQWIGEGKFETDDQYEYIFTRKTIMLGVDFSWPLKY